MARQRNITVDARLLAEGKVGHYLRRVIPSLLADNPDLPLTLLAREDDAFRWLGDEDISSKVSVCEAGAMTLHEQLALIPYIGRNTFFWSPYYNTPLFHPGQSMVSVHDVEVLRLKEANYSYAQRSYAWLMYQYMAKRTDVVLCSTQFTAREVQELASVPEGKCFVCTPGVHPYWFEPVEGPSLHHKPYILYVGDMAPQRNLKTLLTAFWMMRGKVEHDLVVLHTDPDFSLVKLDPEVGRLAARLENRIYFLSHAGMEETRQLFYHASAYIDPSYYTGFTSLPLQAMACGCPTIVAEAGCLPEICGNGCIYFYPHDPLDIMNDTIDVLNMTEREKTLYCANAKNWASQFSWSQHIDILSTLLKAFV